MSADLPKEFVERIRLQFPTFSDSFFDALNSEPSLSIRLNSAKPIDVFDNQKSVPWCEQGRYVEQRPQFTLDPLYHSGCYYSQEASSMFLWTLLSQVLPNTSNARVLDLCAAPGGKSTLIASYLNGNGVLIANETIRPRAHILAENITKWGYSNVLVAQNDPSRFTAFNGFFDVVVVDAPCSGEGMFRKDHDARGHWSEGNVELCAARQKRILADIWPTVKEGGFLIYSTCTFNDSENQDNINWLIDSFDAQVQSFSIPKDWQVQTVPIGSGEGYIFYPHLVKGEGFFCAVVQKTSAERPEKKIKKEKDFPILPINKANLPSGLLNLAFGGQIADFKGRLYALPNEVVDAFVIASGFGSLLHAGIPLGERMRNELIPHQALAMSINIGNTYPIINVSLETAIEYLKGSTQLDLGVINGWALVAYGGYKLGFIKGMGSRFNNYYPKEWRIRMR